MNGCLVVVVGCYSSKRKSSKIKYAMITELWLGFRAPYFFFNLSYPGRRIQVQWSASTSERGAKIEWQKIRKSHLAGMHIQKKHSGFGCWCIGQPKTWTEHWWSSVQFFNSSLQFLFVSLQLGLTKISFFGYSNFRMVGWPGCSSPEWFLPSFRF